CAEAYGERHPEATQQIPREQVPAEIPLELGLQLQLQTPTGQLMPVTIAEITEETVTLDANHPLAGKDLTFDFELVELVWSG
ncbi:peptidylprolyl isomerase, partial [Escherichia coli]|nr:peptidylprolyl isomerase [Escherichia coli]